MSAMKRITKHVRVACPDDPVTDIGTAGLPDPHDPVHPSQNAGLLQCVDRSDYRRATALCLFRDALITWKTQAGFGVMKLPQQRLQHVHRGAGDRPVMLAWLLRFGVPGDSKVNDSNFGVAIKGYAWCVSEQLFPVWFEDFVHGLFHGPVCAQLPDRCRRWVGAETQAAKNCGWQPAFLA